MSRQKAEGKKGRTGKVVVLAVVIVAAAAAGGMVITKLGTGTGRSSDLADVSTETAFTGSISVTAEGNGSIEAASTKAIALEYDGKLDEIYIETGDQISVGDVLAVYDADALDTVIEEKETKLSEIDDQIAELDDSGSSVISAKVSGRVKRIYATDGARVDSIMQQYGCLAEISADGKLKVTFTDESGSLVAGDEVTVEFDSYTVDGIVAEADGDTVTVTFEDDTEYKVDQTAKVYGRSGALLGEGTISSSSPYLVTASYGTIDSVDVDRETKVSAGDTLFSLRDYTYNQEYLDLLEEREELVEELQELKNYQKNPQVVSEYDGYILSMDVMEGMNYEKDQQFCTVADTQTLYLKVDIDELNIDGVKEGQTAQVVFDAFEDEVYEGTVEKVSGVGENSGGVTTYTVTISLEGNEKQKNAMSATAEIEIESKDNVLLVPVDAVESENGQRYVEVYSGGSVVKTPVTVGLVNNEYAEITEGLQSGAQVVVAESESTDLFSQMLQQGGNAQGQGE